jgi:hypothetical protein
MMPQAAITCQPEKILPVSCYMVSGQASARGGALRM